MKKSGSSKPNPIFSTQSPSTHRSAGSPTNVYQRMINDSNRRIMARHRIQNFKPVSKKGSSQVFQRLIQDVNRRQQSKKMIKVMLLQQTQSYLKKFKSNKTISTAQSEATFNRLISDAATREQIMKKKLQLKEFQESIQLASFNSDIKNTKERQIACIERLQKYGKIIIKKHQQQKNQQEEMELKRFQKKREKIHPKRPENLEYLIQLSSSRQQGSPVKLEQKRLSLIEKKLRKKRAGNTPKSARNSIPQSYKFDELDKFLMNTVPEAPRKAPLPIMVPDLLSTIEAFDQIIQ